VPRGPDSGVTTLAEVYAISEAGSGADPIVARSKRAFASKERWNSLFDECFDYTMPGRTGMFDDSPGQKRTAEIFDETAVSGVQEFASRIQSGLTPGHVRWAMFAPGNAVPAELKQQMLEPLEQMTGLVFDILQNTNISAELHECYLDLAVGTGVLRVDNGDSLELVRFRSIPMPNVALDEGPDGKIDGVFVRHWVEPTKISVAFPGASNLDEKEGGGPGKKVCLIESCHRVWERSNEYVYKHCVYSEKTGKKVFETELVGIGSSPFVVFRWAKAAGETWGRGPIVNSLSSIKTVNLISQFVLENADLAVSGMYQVDDDGTVNPDTIRIAPGAVIPVAPNTRGIQPINSASRFDVAGLVLDEIRDSIRRGLFNERLGSPDQSPKTATEIAERMADLSRRLSGTYSRLQNELVVPLMQRVVYILRMRGLIDAPPVNGLDIRVVASAPLSQAQRFQDVENFARFMQMLGGLFGGQIANLMVDQEKSSTYLAENLAVPATLLRSPEERAQLVQQLAQAAGQQAGDPNEQIPQEAGPPIG